MGSTPCFRIIRFILGMINAFNVREKLAPVTQTLSSNPHHREWEERYVEIRTPLKDAYAYILLIALNLCSVRSTKALWTTRFWNMCSVLNIKCKALFCRFTHYLDLYLCVKCVSHKYGRREVAFDDIKLKKFFLILFAKLQPWWVLASQSLSQSICKTNRLGSLTVVPDLNQTAETSLRSYCQ